jgi:hypothetical protein
MPTTAAPEVILARSWACASSEAEEALFGKRVRPKLEFGPNRPPLAQPARVGRPQACSL